MALLEAIKDKSLVIPISQLREDRVLLKEIQIELERLGFYSYETNNDPDGIYGPRTSSAIDSFCDSVYLNCFDTGIYGPSFAIALMTTKPNQTLIPTWWEGGSKNELAAAVAKQGKIQGITDRNQLCYIMATIQHETDHTYRPIAEYGGPSKWYAPYYGRGYVQITHKYNYEAYSEKLGINLVRDTKKVMEPDISLFIILDGMKNGVFTTRKIGDYINSQKVDFLNARRVINGTDRMNLIASYAKEWQKTTIF
jgi:predicted chitinase